MQLLIVLGKEHLKDYKEEYFWKTAASQVTVMMLCVEQPSTVR